MAKEYDCEHCEHWVKDSFGDRVCEFDGDCENPAPQTNEEYLRSLNTEQLAEWIISLCVTYFDRTDLSIVGAVKESIKINDHYDGHIQKDLLVEWLKQPKVES